MRTNSHIDPWSKLAMASLDDLPVEVRLQILAHLPLQSLLWIRLICRRWNDFFVANTSAVYRNAAAREGFVEPLEMPLAQAVADARYVNNVQNDTEPPDWYTFCRVKAMYLDFRKLAPLIHRILVDAREDLYRVDSEYICKAILERDENITLEFLEMPPQIDDIYIKVYNDSMSTLCYRPLTEAEAWHERARACSSTRGVTEPGPSIVGSLHSVSFRTRAYRSRRELRLR
ncbi:hypothetical protein PYCCODRAFT_751872 [Trametes coccinea BRFM310]|uniref:F-box domain-containing protein n=1 Tax=Trametes coccinea (strain BRFM310) TaxID=1353009 RepID=A0A1Y2IF59_TRAC3|nr:hypothetical protein PYCCODRAFT_751872 [Trametes coccinea BRFM310]